MTTQACPNCHAVNDTAVYVSGQRHRCVRCGISFEVRRSDAAVPVPRAVAASGGPGGVAVEADRPRGPEAPHDAPAGRDNVVPIRAGVEPAAGEDRTFIRKQQPGVGAPDIPGFELIEVLGRGGMGEVWRAQQKSLGRTVAIKLLPQRLAEDPEFVARFAKEATALAALSHPNIIQIIDRGVEAGSYYFVMEYVAGRSLRDLLQAGRLTPLESLRVAAQVARAMQCAHEQKIIHRDLKPDNILVDERGHVKVADFGLAGMQQPDGTGPQLTSTSVAMGTVNYMAPEQRRDAKHVDGRADLYSLGVMLYEMVTGELPLGRFRMPCERVPGLDPRFDAVVGKLLEPDADARYARAADLLGDLEPMLTEHASSAHASQLSISRSSASAAALPATPTPRHVSRPQMVVEKSFSGLRNGMMLVGVLALLGFLLVRFSGGRWQVGSDGLDVEVGKARLELPWSSHGPSAPGGLPPNTDGELKARSTYRLDPSGAASLKVDFASGGREVIHAHAGQWQLDEGLLTVTQAGNQTTGTGPLIPRAYVDDRVFLSDDFTAAVEMRVSELDARLNREPDAMRFGELAFRLNEVQVSAFADPVSGMRLVWKYPTAQGDQEGNSARDVQAGLADVVPVPADRSFNLRLTLKRRGSGVEAQAAVDDQVFASRYLPGLHAVPGKVALGCRNMHCAFQSLEVRGHPSAEPRVGPESARHERAER